MIPALIVFIYLAVILYVGIFAFRSSGRDKEDFFLANRSLGTFVFLLSLFGSNMTSFAILGSSGLAFKQGIGVFGLMASISGIIIPLSLFFIGTRLWSLGKRFGHITQVQILRDRFEMRHIGTAVFVLQAIMLVPYIIIGVMGGGETLSSVSGDLVPYWLGGLIVALVVMSYVFFGGMRGTAWVNAIQTLMFLTFGTIAFIVIARGMGGIGATVERMARSLEATNAPGYAGPPAAATDGALLTRDRMQFWGYASYALIPLSSIMFPHIAIFCLTAKKMASFKRTVILYPLCIMAIWLPAVFLGALAAGQPGIVADMAAHTTPAKTWIAQRGAPPANFKLDAALKASKDAAAADLLQRVRDGGITSEQLTGGLLAIKDPVVRREVRTLASSDADGVMLDLLRLFSPLWLAGILGAAIMACVMASDSQILALSTMFSEDIFHFYGHRERFGQHAEIWFARAFVVILTVVAYAIAITVHEFSSIFELAIQYAFTGYASMAPIMVGALFWKRATKWGVLASVLWIFACLIGAAALQAATPPPTQPGTANVVWSIGQTPILLREATRLCFTNARMLMVVPTFAGSVLLMWLVSLLTPPASQATLDRYFPRTS